MMSLATMLASGNPSRISFRDSWPKQQPTSCALRVGLGIGHTGRAAWRGSRSRGWAGSACVVTSQCLAAGRGTGSAWPRLAVPVSRKLGSAGLGVSAAWAL
jgi:hypothetical protein